MKFSKLLIYCFLAGLFFSCETIDEDERFIGPVDFAPKKNVLIEDFTGQRCVNCPRAADAVHSLQETYGANHVISVAIHGGAMALPNSSPVGLATPLGEEYNTYWNVDSWPKGLVDRKGGLLEYTSWSAAVVKRLQEDAPLALAMSGNTYDAATRTLNVSVDMEAYAAVTGKLQVWLVESNITAFQSMPDGSHNTNYQHHHVLRDAVNGSWGEEVVIAAEGTLQKQYSYQLSDSWKPENMSVIAFVYNEVEGVMQVIGKPILNN